MARPVAYHSDSGQSVVLARVEDHMKKPVPATSLPSLSADLKQQVLGRARSAVLSESADIDRIMKAASTTLVDPGVPIGGYVDGQRRAAQPVAEDGAGGMKKKLLHVYIDADVGFLLKETAARGRVSPRVLLEAIIKAACSGDVGADKQVKSGSVS